MTFTFTIPSPETLLQFTWFLMGVTFGRGFGKELDQTIQKSDWFKKQVLWKQEVIRRVLDVTHHFWIGLLLVNYFTLDEVVWFGWGLVVDDLPDIPARFGIDVIKDRLYGVDDE